MDKLSKKTKNVHTYFECAYTFKGEDGMVVGVSNVKVTIIPK